MREEFLKYRLKKVGINVIDARSGDDRELDYGFCYIYKGKLHIAITLVKTHDYIVLDLENAIKFYEYQNYRLNNLFSIVVDFLIKYKDDYDIKLNQKKLKHLRSVFRREQTTEESICAFNEILLMLIQKRIIPKIFKL